MRLWPSAIQERFGRIPTTDLYFLNPLRHLICKIDAGRRLPRLDVLAPGLYRIGRTGVIVRYGEAADLERLRKAGASRIVYIADDDFEAGAEDASLPETYRAKLARFAIGPWPILREAADIVVVPGAVLAALYGEKAVIVGPAWRQPPASLEHFESPRSIEIAHLGTASHRADLAALAEPLAALLDAHPDVRLTLFGGHAPPSLRAHARVRVKAPMRWWRYQRALPRMRFHLALYPLADTPVNRARSANKLFEHAVVGAASLMSPNPALRDTAGPQGDALFVEGGVEAWRAAVAADLAEPTRLHRRAEATRAHILARDPLARAAEQWLEILAPEIER